jgi:HEAT repeat protein
VLHCSGDDFEKEACFAIGLIATKPSYQQRITDAGALPGIVALLKRLPPAHLVVASGSTAGGVARRAADAITNLAHENVEIKGKVRSEGGIPPLVALLESHDSKVQRAAAGALRTLAFKNEDNKNLIVDCGALPLLIHMVREADAEVHYEAIGVLGNLVHSSAGIKKRVLDEGALQPVISLLSSVCPESQREAALLLGQFATTEPDVKIKIVQRGAVPPLIAMLKRDDPQLREMAAFALGRLAQNGDNQAGICHAGGLRPLLDLLDDKGTNGSLQHNAAFALYGLADNEDNVAEMVKEGTVQRLMDADLNLQASKDCVQKTLKRLEDKCIGKPFAYLLYVLRPALRSKLAERETARRVAVALAAICRVGDAADIFGAKGGLDVLLDMLMLEPASAPLAGALASQSRLRGSEPLGCLHDEAAQRESARALVSLADKCRGILDVAPAAPDPSDQLKLWESYDNSPAAADVTFVVDGKDFYAQRITLQAASDTFRAMFDGCYKERDKGARIEIPNIPRDVFEAMMRCIYTGNVDVTPDIAQELLRAADQYLLTRLKRLCETAIEGGLCCDNLLAVYELAQTYHAEALGQACVLFALKNRDEYVKRHGFEGFTDAVKRMQPTCRSYFETMLKPKSPASAASGDDVAMLVADA